MGDKNDNAPPTSVFKFSSLCECQGCTDQIKRAVRVSGVEDFEVDWSAKTLTVIGNVDTAKVRDNLKKEFPKKEVELVPPQPEKDAATGNKKQDDTPEEKADKKNSDDKKDQDEEPIENELTKVKGEVKEKEMLLKLQKLEIQETTTMIQVEETSQEADLAQNEADRARNEVERARNEAERARNEAESARNEAERARNFADRARNEAERAQNKAERAQNELIEAEDLLEKLEQTQMLKLKYQETNVRATYVAQKR